jgi:hypothetical protein
MDRSIVILQTIIIICEAFPPECICPDVNRKIRVIIWGYITYNGVCTLTKNDGTLNAAKYINL